MAACFLEDILMRSLACLHGYQVHALHNQHSAARAHLLQASALAQQMSCTCI